MSDIPHTHTQPTASDLSAYRAISLDICGDFRSMCVFFGVSVCVFIVCVAYNLDDIRVQLIIALEVPMQKKPPSIF